MWSASGRPWPASLAVAPNSPPKRPRKPASDLQRALRLLARREWSRAELRRRLAAGSATPEAAHPADDGSPEAPEHPPQAAAAGVEQALDRLQGLGLQSDARVAEVHVRGRQARTGSRRLAAELRQRGIDAETIGAALAGIADSDLQRARALWQRRFEPSREPRERARQMRFLAARGFDLAVIRAVLGGDVVDEAPPGSDDAAP